jgi:hypothetical protein
MTTEEEIRELAKAHLKFYDIIGEFCNECPEDIQELEINDDVITFRTSCPDPHCRCGHCSDIVDEYEFSIQDMLRYKSYRIQHQGDGQ